MLVNMASAQITTREERGQEIAQHTGEVTRIEEDIYSVKSQSQFKWYRVTRTGYGWSCTCPDNTYRGVICKHIYAVDFSTQLRQKVAHNHVIQEVNVHQCPICHSENIVKDSVRHNQNGDIQRYKCKACGKRFSINLGFEKMKATPQIVTSAMQLYFTGESFRNVQKFLKLQGVNVDHSTILRWVKKYVTLMQQYVEKIQPNVGNTWRADELYVKINGNLKYLFAMMDDQTRFWIAQEVAQTKHTHDATKLFEQAKTLMGKQPKTIITDGLPTYSTASEIAFDEAQHIREIKFDNIRNNNKMERMNGEIRDREKVMRGLKIDNTTVLKGYQIYHNYIRPHEALKRQNPFGSMRNNG